ncbi:MAG: diaminopimelate decarboxylase [Candidatus Eisenbacteria bacterium]|nr:diaminopimelate decarboxylase [Candidatus Eisenbacteria bacterium]
MLLVGGIPITTIANANGTPMYVYDGDMVRDRYQALKEAFPSFEIFYSMKANPSMALVGLLRSLGAGSEIASGGELFLAKETGHDPLDIVFAGPGKTDRELEDAIISGIFAVNVESLRELERLSRIAGLVGVPARAALRINTSVGLSKSGTGSAGPLHERMAGGPSKFGIDEEKLDGLRGAWDRRAVDIVGIHVYTASQILDADEIVENARRTMAVAERVERLTGEPLMAIDFGAGFGVPHYDEEGPLDLPSLGRRVEDVFKPYSDRGDGRLILELGRYLVSECGVFVTRVIELKESRGERFVITDGGINQFVRPVLMKVRHEARVVSRLSSPTSTEAKVSGPLCTPIDITSEKIQVPDDIALDDLIGIFNAGAYGFSMSPQLFLSHPSPVELLVLDGEVIEARSRGTYEDFLLRQNPLPGTV